MRIKKLIVIAVFCCGLLPLSLQSGTLPDFYQTPATKAAAAAYDLSQTVFFPVYGKHGMVVSEQELATAAGLTILKKGGNAVDAAVAVALALAVVLPNAGNIGGGGFMLVYEHEEGQVQAVDFRETAPARADKNSFLDGQGEVIAGRSLNTPYASGVPGTVAGLSYAHKKWGKLPWRELVKPAVILAQKGFKVSPALALKLQASAAMMGKFPATTQIFWRNGEPLAAGDLLVQKDLARSLKLIARDGEEAFYRGKIARQIAAAMPPAGWLTLDDLKNYQVKTARPLTGTYRGYDIVTMPPPSSGMHIIQILNILERWPLGQWGQNSAKSIHYMAEAMKLAYADRAEYAGDPAFVSLPVTGIIAKTYANRLARSIGPRSRPVTAIKAGRAAGYESGETTHLSIIDGAGNAVSLTYTLNGNFGSGMVAAGSGILLNNEMDDFALKPGVANMYGLIGGKANEVAAGKRPFSSMSPTMVFKDGQLRLVTGSPGGARIITTVVQMLINYIDYGLNPAEATAAARVHDQWLPAEIWVEKTLSPDTVKLLRQRGHVVRVKAAMGKTATIVKTDAGVLEGAADVRNPDARAAGY